MNKKELLQFIINKLKKKRLFLEQELKDLSESLANSAKSSAGDKHETETAMNQLEQEQLTRQLLALRHQQQLVQQLNPQGKHTGKTHKNYYRKFGKNIKRSIFYQCWNWENHL